MKYLQKTWTLPVSDRISQDDWNKIWSNFYEVGESGKLVQPLKSELPMERTFQCGSGEMGVLYWSKDSTSYDWCKENDDGA